jgi:hypothetical protein
MTIDVTEKEGLVDHYRDYQTDTIGRMKQVIYLPNFVTSGIGRRRSTELETKIIINLLLVIP